MIGEKSPNEEEKCGKHPNIAGSFYPLKAPQDNTVERLRVSHDQRHCTYTEAAPWQLRYYVDTKHELRQNSSEPFLATKNINSDVLGMLLAPPKSGIKTKVTASIPPSPYSRPKSVILINYFWLWMVLLPSKKNSCQPW